MPIVNYSVNRDDNAGIVPGNIRTADKSLQQIVNSIRQLMADMKVHSTTVTNDASNLTTGTLPDGRFPAVLPVISGANLTNLNANNLASGTVPNGRFPATLPAASGVNLTNLNGSNIASGTVADARIAAALSGKTLTGSAFNGTVGATTPSSGVFTTVLATSTLSQGAYSGTGATAGVQHFAGQTGSSHTATTSFAHYLFVNPNGAVGSITTFNLNASFNTTSDGDLKEDFRDFDADGILDSIEMRQFRWRTNGEVGFGPSAQDLYRVFPVAVTPGRGKPGDLDYVPWQYDASKLVPIIVRKVQKLENRARNRMQALEARIDALEAR